MPAEGKGRHCGQCSKTIIDFSHLSDEALLNYFKTHGTVHCGRFHVEQLNRLILPSAAKARPVLQMGWLKKAVAVLSGILLLKYASVAGSKEKTIPATRQQPTVKKNDAAFVPDSIVLSGQVKDEFNKALHGARVTIDNDHFTDTDENGMFSVTVEKEVLLKYTYTNVSFSYSGYVTAIRSYHISMGSTSFNVTLEPPSQGRIIMGAIYDPSIEIYPSIVFKSNTTLLKADNKQMLEHIAYQLKTSPTTNILIKAYLPAKGGDPIADKRLYNIKAYLVNQQGIRPERIRIHSEREAGDINTVDILNDNNQH